MLLKLAVLVLCCTAFTDANRCRNRYRELRGPVEEVHRPRGCRGAGSFIGEDYWTTVGYDGLIRDGRSTADFLHFEQGPKSKGYVAYWITRTRYGNVHYEAFGHAFTRPDGRICAWFVGLDKNIVEVCGGFRVLSKNRYRPSEPVPFEWVQGGHLDAKQTLGFHEHRIAKYAWQDDEVFYGDARLRDRNFQGVSPNSERFLEVTSPSEFDSKVWLLRRRPDVPLPEDQGMQPAMEQRRQQEERYQQQLREYQQQQQQRNANPRLQDPAYRARYYQQQQPPRFVNRTVDSWATPQESRQPQVDQRRQQQDYRVESRRDQQLHENVDEYGRPRIGYGARPQEAIANGAEEQSRMRYAKVRPPTIVRDQYGNTYERRIENGHAIFYADPHTHGKKIEAGASQQQSPASAVDFRYQNAEWVRHQQRMREAEEERRRQAENIRSGWLLTPDQPEAPRHAIGTGVRPDHDSEAVRHIPSQPNQPRNDGIVLEPVNEDRRNVVKNVGPGSSFGAAVMIPADRTPVGAKEAAPAEEKPVNHLLRPHPEVDQMPIPVAKDDDEGWVEVEQNQEIPEKLPAPAALHQEEEKEDEDDWKF